jgi:hypothetical protein
MFKMKISRARFTYTPFSSEAMARIGQAAVGSIKKRIQSGVDANDQAAKELNPQYANYKRRNGLRPIRDWTKSGLTMASLAVKSANENRVTIGFTDDRGDRIVSVQNLRCKMYGISPGDRAAVVAAIRAELARTPPVRLKRAA